MTALLNGLFRFSRKQEAAPKQAEELHSALVAEKAAKVLALAASLKQKIRVLYAAKTALYTAAPHDKQEAQKRCDAAVADLEIRSRTFAKALAINKARFDDELNQLLENYWKTMEHALDPAVDFQAMSRKIIKERQALADAIGKIENKVKQLQK